MAGFGCYADAPSARFPQTRPCSEGDRSSEGAAGVPLLWGVGFAVTLTLQGLRRGTTGHPPPSGASSGAWPLISEKSADHSPRFLFPSVAIAPGFGGSPPAAPFARRPAFPEVTPGGKSLDTPATAESTDEVVRPLPGSRGRAVPLESASHAVPWSRPVPHRRPRLGPAPVADGRGARPASGEGGARFHSREHSAFATPVN